MEEEAGDKIPLYKKVGRIILEQIENRTFLPGDRLPSQRELSRRLKVGIGTVQHAYADLEDRGVVRPKKRSGYFVAPGCPMAPAADGVAPFTPVPSSVNVLETAVSVMRSAARKNMVQLGSAVPNVRGKAVGELHLALKRHAGKVPNYEEDPRGYLPLRRRLAGRMQVGGDRVHPDEIIVTAGCQEALTIALRCIAGPGDVIAVESPCYYGALQALEVMGLKAVEIPASPVDGIDTRVLASVLGHGQVKGVLLNPAFSNPSGYLCSEEKKREIIRLIREYDVPLIEDDVFAELGFSGERPGTIKSLDRDGRVILCGSISKTLCPDLRVGWMAAGRYTESARRLKYISTLCAPCHPQFALAEFLENRRFERHLRWVRGEYRKRQKILIDAVRRRLPAETTVTRPEGGFLCWLKLPEGVDGLTLYRDAVQEKITLTPGEICSPTGAFKNHIRLNYAVASTEQIDDSMKILARLIHARAEVKGKKSILL